MPQRWQPPDLDEFRPDRFTVNNEKVQPFLRGEGVREGVYFQLQSWRREGWLARLRAAGFNVRTLDDRVESLPVARGDVATGVEGLRVLGSSRERIAAWDPERLRWRDLPLETVDGVPAVRLRVGEPVRRRRSRSGGDYFIAVADRAGQIGLHPVTETDAILRAYALLADTGRPAVLRFSETPAGYHVPADQALVPQPYREVLDRLATEGDSWTFPHACVPLAERVFEKLQVDLERHDSL